jgi:folate-dependent phosphoribosylglycinamide formyltransferase PurN
MTPDPAPNGPLRVAVVSCHDYAWATVRELSRLDGIAVVGFLQGELPRPRLSVRLRRFWRAQGPRMGQAAVTSTAQKIWKALGGVLHRNDSVPGVAHVHVESLDSPEAVTALESLQPDLMVVDGGSILKPTFFGKPRFGAINLHCGKLPDYRGMPPAFWELYHGEREVGVSVHAISAKLDEGAVFAATTVPLDVTPTGDPVQYVTTFWKERLRPVGIQLIAQTVRAIANGTATPSPQGPATRPPFRSPSFREKRELRRRVAQRRASAR